MNTFKKREKLLGNKSFNEVVTKGKVFFKFPFKIYYYILFEQEYPIKIAFNVPKRNFKQAVKRNLIKRRMKEIYRLNKLSFYSVFKKNEINIMALVIYTDKSIKTYKSLEKEFVKVFQSLISSIIHEKSY